MFIIKKVDEVKQCFSFINITILAARVRGETSCQKHCPSSTPCTEAALYFPLKGGEKWDSSKVKRSEVTRMFELTTFVPSFISHARARRRATN
jgi:hypothetical protein